MVGVGGSHFSYYTIIVFVHAEKAVAKAPYIRSLTKENTCGAFFCYASLHELRSVFALQKDRSLILKRIPIFNPQDRPED